MEAEVERESAARARAARAITTSRTYTLCFWTGILVTCIGVIVEIAGMGVGLGNHILEGETIEHAGRGVFFGGLILWSLTELNINTTFDISPDKAAVFAAILLTRTTIAAFKYSLVYVPAALLLFYHVTWYVFIGYRSSAVAGLHHAIRFSDIFCAWCIFDLLGSGVVIIHGSWTRFRLRDEASESISIQMKIVGAMQVVGAVGVLAYYTTSAKYKVLLKIFYVTGNGEASVFFPVLYLYMLSLGACFLYIGALQDYTVLIIDGVICLTAAPVWYFRQPLIGLAAVLVEEVISASTTFHELSTTLAHLMLFWGSIFLNGKGL